MTESAKAKASSPVVVIPIALVLAFAGNWLTVERAVSKIEVLLDETRAQVAKLEGRFEARDGTLTTLGAEVVALKGRVEATGNLAARTERDHLLLVEDVKRIERALRRSRIDLPE